MNVNKLFLYSFLFFNMNYAYGSTCSSLLESDYEIISLEDISPNQLLPEATLTVDFTLIDEALKTLDATEKDIFVLYHAEGLSLHEISTTLDIYPYRAGLLFKKATQKVQEQVLKMRSTPDQVIKQFLNEQIAEAQAKYKNRISYLSTHLEVLLNITSTEVGRSGNMTANREWSLRNTPGRRAKKEALLQALSTLISTINESPNLNTRSLPELRSNQKEIFTQLKDEGHTVIDELSKAPFNVSDTLIKSLHRDWEQILKGKLQISIDRASWRASEHFRYWPL